MIRGLVSANSDRATRRGRAARPATSHSRPLQRLGTATAAPGARSSPGSLAVLRAVLADSAARLAAGLRRRTPYRRLGRRLACGRRLLRIVAASVGRHGAGRLGAGLAGRRPRRQPAATAAPRAASGRPAARAWRRPRCAPAPCVRRGTADVQRRGDDDRTGASGTRRSGWTRAGCCPDGPPRVVAPRTAASCRHDHDVGRRATGPGQAATPISAPGRTAPRTRSRPPP